MFCELLLAWRAGCGEAVANTERQVRQQWLILSGRQGRATRAAVGARQLQFGHSDRFMWVVWLFSVVILWSMPIRGWEDDVKAAKLKM